MFACTNDFFASNDKKAQFCRYCEFESNILDTVCLYEFSYLAIHQIVPVRFLATVFTDYHMTMVSYSSDSEFTVIFDN